MNKLTSLLPQHRKVAGFAPSGCIEMLLLAYIVAAVLNYALGNWIFATAMLAPLVGLLLWVQYTDRRDRFKIGDQIQVRLGPHAGMEAVIVGTGEMGTRFTVQLSSEEQTEPVVFSGYQITKVKRSA